jgi:transposase
LGKQRRSYTEEFKAEAVRAATAGDRSLTQVARDLGVNASVLQSWKQRLTAATGDAAGKRDETLEQENRRLRRENALLREDREILKKAATFFAKEHR